MAGQPLGAIGRKKALAVGRQISEKEGARQPLRRLFSRSALPAPKGGFCCLWLAPHNADGAKLSDSGGAYPHFMHRFVHRRNVCTQIRAHKIYVHTLVRIYTLLCIRIDVHTATCVYWRL